MKKYLFSLVFIISISLCGCNNGSDVQQDNMLISDMTVKTEVNERESSEIIPEQRISQLGNVANLGFGFLVYTIPSKDDDDYRLYFYKSEKEEDRYLSLSEISFNLSEASYIFPDVREGNIPIGKFKEIYYLETGDILQDGIQDIIIIAVYEKDGNEYYDTRIYEASENGYVVNIALTQELNEKYYNVEDYPVQDVISMHSDHD